MVVLLPLNVAVGVMHQVWPEWKVVFPDFFHANASRVWTELIVNHHQELVFDGLWIVRTACCTEEKYMLYRMKQY